MLLTTVASPASCSRPRCPPGGGGRRPIKSDRNKPSLRPAETSPADKTDTMRHFSTAVHGASVEEPKRARGRGGGGCRKRLEGSGGRHLATVEHLEDRTGEGQTGQPCRCP